MFRRHFLPRREQSAALLLVGARRLVTTGKQSLVINSITKRTAFKFAFTVLIDGSQGSSGSVVTRLWAGKPRNRGSIPVRANGFFSKRSTPAQGPIGRQYRAILS